MILAENSPSWLNLLVKSFILTTYLQLGYKSYDHPDRPFPGSTAISQKKTQTL